MKKETLSGSKNQKDPLLIPKYAKGCAVIFQIMKAEYARQ